MDETFLNLLIPRPLKVHTHTLSGRLYIYGNIAANVLLFCFKFDLKEEVSPVIVHVEVDGQVHAFFLDIKEENNMVVKTPVLHPPFCVKKNWIKVTKIEAQIGNGIANVVDI
jgi:hypothetical protein